MRDMARGKPVEPDRPEASSGVYPFPFPARFLDFLRQRMEPTEAQAVLFGVACDGDEPSGEIARALFGDIPTPCDRHWLVLVKGARMGGTYLCALRLLHLALTLDVARLAPGERASALIVGPQLALARQALRFAHGAASADPIIATMMTGQDTDDGFEIVRPDGTIVIEALAATRGGIGVRARSLIGAHLTEFGFFRDSNYTVNDAEILDAVSPRIVEGGQVLMESTPWVASGKLYSLFRDQWGKSETCVVAKAPTLLMRRGGFAWASVQAEVAREKDPENAAREFGAEFVHAGSSAFFDPRALDAAVDDAIVLGTPPAPGVEVSGGGDFGFRSDSSALAISHRTDGLYVTADLLELRPERDMPLKPSATVKEFAKMLLRHGADYLMADQHYRESITELLGAYDLGFVTAPSKPADAYQRAKQLLHEGKVRIPRHDRLIQQLRDVTWKPQPGGGVQIIQQRKPGGGHGDLASAWVLSLFPRAGVEAEAPKPTPGTDEAAAKYHDDRLAARQSRDTTDRPYWAAETRWKQRNR